MPTYTGKTTSRLTATVRRWTNIVRVAMPRARHTSSMVYLRVDYELEPDARYGFAEIRAVRPNGDDTAVDGLFLPGPTAGATPGGKGTRGGTRHWSGANPGALTWQVLPREGVKALTVRTRYGKGQEEDT